MSLPPPSARRKLHNRTIVCEGYEREDGLYDIDARIVDTKTFAVDHSKRGQIPPGSAIHDMELRLTVDTDKVVREIAVFTNAGPYAPCFTVAPAFQKLVGASLTKGWRKTVSEAVGGELGCTHLKELLGPVATVVMQTITGGQKALRAAQAADPKTSPVPFFLNGCKAWSQDGELVKELLPQFYVGPAGGKAG